MQITQNGLARSVIVTGKKATWLERHTAEELRDYIEKISGAALLVVAEQDIAGLPGGRILLSAGRKQNGLVRAFDERENNVLPAYSETAKRLRRHRRARGNAGPLRLQRPLGSLRLLPYAADGLRRGFLFQTRTPSSITPIWPCRI